MQIGRLAGFNEFPFVELVALVLFEGIIIELLRRHENFGLRHSHSVHTVKHSGSDTAPPTLVRCSPEVPGANLPNEPIFPANLQKGQKFATGNRTRKTIPARTRGHRSSP